MANSQNSSSPSWTSRLPLSVWNVFGSMMDREGMRNMHLVSKEWQKVVEESIGLKVKVDDSIDGNLDFVKRVKAGSARVVNWTEEIGAEPATHLFQNPDWLKKLKLSGKMPAQWKIHNLGQFSSLAHLVLRDKVLYYNNITGHQYPVLNFDPLSQLSIEKVLIKAFESQDPPLESQPIELKSLRTLEIVRNQHWNHEEPQTQGYLVMVVNICFILNNVKSPLLSVVHLAVSLPAEISSSLNKLSWTLVPMHRFLDNHRASLREFLLPTSLNSPDLFRLEDLSKSFPAKLQKVMLKLDGPTRGSQREALVKSTFNYLEKCLQGQTQLQDVHFNFSYFPLKWTSDALISLANSCDRTLKYLELKGYPDRHTESLDLKLLSVCQCLEVLQMVSCGLTKDNVDKLPASLKRLVIIQGDEGGDVGIEDPNIFKRLTVLEWLYLDAIRLPTASNNGNQDPQRQFCRTMIKDLVGLRQLQGFNVGVQGMGLNTDVSLVNMLSPLDPRINPAQRRPRSRVSFNLNWRWYDDRSPPWSEKRFDMRKWDLEKIKDDTEEPRRGVVGRADVNADDEDDDFEDDQDDDMDDQDDDMDDQDDDMDDQDDDMDDAEEPRRAAVQFWPFQIMRRVGAGENSNDEDDDFEDVEDGNSD